MERPLLARSGRSRAKRDLLIDTAWLNYVSPLLTGRLRPGRRFPIVEFPNQFHQLRQQRRSVVFTMAHDDRANDLRFFQIQIDDIRAPKISYRRRHQADADIGGNQTEGSLQFAHLENRLWWFESVIAKE
jgi:hypothetical protein